MSAGQGVELSTTDPLLIFDFVQEQLFAVHEEAKGIARCSSPCTNTRKFVGEICPAGTPDSAL